VNGKGPSISCIAKLRLQRSPYDFGELATECKDIQSPAQAKLSPIIGKLSAEKIATSSSLKRRRGYEEPSTRARSSSFPRPTASCTKHISPLPTRKRISNDIRKPRSANDPSTRGITRKIPHDVEPAKDESYNINAGDGSASLALSTKTESSHRDNDLVSNEGQIETRLEEGLTKAAIIKQPTDVTVLKGSKAMLKVAYRGCPEPAVKWLRVVSSFSCL